MGVTLPGPGAGFIPKFLSDGAGGEGRFSLSALLEMKTCGKLKQNAALHADSCLAVLWGCTLNSHFGGAKSESPQDSSAALGCPTLAFSLCSHRGVGQTGWAGWQTSAAREAFSQA